jgi:chromosome segregation ATPase
MKSISSPHILRNRLLAVLSIIVIFAVLYIVFHDKKTYDIVTPQQETQVTGIITTSGLPYSKVISSNSNTLCSKEVKERYDRDISGILQELDSSNNKLVEVSKDLATSKTELEESKAMVASLKLELVASNKKLVTATEEWKSNYKAAQGYKTKWQSSIIPESTWKGAIKGVLNGHQF